MFFTIGGATARRARGIAAASAMICLFASPASGETVADTRARAQKSFQAALAACAGFDESDQKSCHAGISDRLTSYAASIQGIVADEKKLKKR